MHAEFDCVCNVYDMNDNQAGGCDISLESVFVYSGSTSEFYKLAWAQFVGKEYFQHIFGFFAYRSLCMHVQARMANDDLQSVAIFKKMV